MRILGFILCFFIIFTTEVALEILPLDEHIELAMENSGEESEEKESNESKEEIDKDIVDLEIDSYTHIEDLLATNCFDTNNLKCLSHLEIHSPPPELI